MKLLPRQPKLFLPLWVEQTEEEQESSGKNGNEEQEESNQPGEGEKTPTGELEENHDGNLLIEDENSEEEIFEDSDDGEGIAVEDEEGEEADYSSAEDGKKGIDFLSKEDQEKADAALADLLSRSSGIIILPVYEEKVKDVMRLRFESQTDLRNATPSKVNINNYEKLKARKTRNSEWFGAGCTTPQDVIELCNNGWSEGVEKILELSQQVNIDDLFGKKPSRQRIRSKLGSVYHIHAARSGRLDKAWTRSVIVQSKKKIRKVELWLQIQGNCMERASDMFWAPATTLALSEFLLRRKIAVRLMACSYQRSPFVDGAYDEAILTTVKLKDFSTKVSIEELAVSAWTGHYRYFWFLAMHACTKQLEYRLGIPRDVDEEYLPLVPKLCKRIVVPRLRSLERSKKWLLEEAKQVMVDIENT